MLPAAAGIPDFFMTDVTGGYGAADAGETVELVRRERPEPGSPTQLAAASGRRDA